MRKKNILRNSKGQFLIETVLLMIISVGLFTSAVKVAQDKKRAAQLIGEPWGSVKGMLESGVWGSSKDSKSKHPNQIRRSATWDPSN